MDGSCIIQKYGPKTRSGFSFPFLFFLFLSFSFFFLSFFLFKIPDFKDMIPLCCFALSAFIDIIMVNIILFLFYFHYYHYYYNKLASKQFLKIIILVYGDPGYGKRTL